MSSNPPAYPDPRSTWSTPIAVLIAYNQEAMVHYCGKAEQRHNVTRDDNESLENFCDRVTKLDEAR
jgi:hypothetical protein